MSWKSSQSQGEKAEPRHGSAIFSCTQRQGLDHEELSSKKHGIAVSFVSIGSLDCFSSVGPGHPALGVPAAAEGSASPSLSRQLMESSDCSGTSAKLFLLCSGMVSVFPRKSPVQSFQRLVPLLINLAWRLHRFVLPLEKPMALRPHHNDGLVTKSELKNNSSTP